MKDRVFSQLLLLHHQQRKSKLPHIPNKTNFIFAACMPITGQLFSDPTGRFVAPSISGNNYILVIYDYDSNPLHVQAMPNRKK